MHFNLNQKTLFRSHLLKSCGEARFECLFLEWKLLCVINISWDGTLFFTPPNKYQKWWNRTLSSFSSSLIKLWTLTVKIPAELKYCHCHLQLRSLQGPEEREFSSRRWLLPESDSPRWAVRQNDENLQRHWVQMFMVQAIYCLYFLLSTFETVSESWSLESYIYHYKHSRVNLTITRKEIQQMNVLAECLMKEALAEILVYRTSFLQLRSTC